MENNSNNLTESTGFIKPHPTWSILDSSKMQELMTCPRKYFYRYILGWTQDIPNIHIAFGSAWHCAMEQLLIKGYGSDGIIAGIDAFNTEFSKKYACGPLEPSSPKSNADIPAALCAYTERYKNDREQTLFTEIAGTVPIGPERVLHFRLDSILKDERERFLSREHKTGSRNDRSWQDQWSLSLQIFGYLHVLYCLYEPEQVYGVTVNGTFFQKSGCDFMRIPIRKNVDMLNAWLYEINHYIDLLEMYQEELEGASPQDQILTTFPKNTTNCTKYFGCPYLAMCSSWANPLAHCSAGPPPGFKVEWWDPSSYTDVKTVFNLEKSQEPLQ